MNIREFFKKYGWIFLIIYFILAWFYPIFGLVALFCMFAPVVTSFWKRRTWCGNYCPRGSFNDSVLSKVSASRPYPRLFLKMWFRLLILGVIMIMFSIQILQTETLQDVGFIFFRMVLLTTALAIILGGWFKHRAWCMICPMGTIAYCVSKNGCKKNLF